MVDARQAVMLTQLDKEMIRRREALDKQAKLERKHSVAQLAIYPDSTMAQTGVSRLVVVDGESFSDALFASAGQG